uniref:Uncharacterized protein n=1 Tax=Arundo donax TaxID=35708 RepID=A0A0A9FMT3_ARUDO
MVYPSRSSTFVDKLGHDST